MLCLTKPAAGVYNYTNFGMAMGEHMFIRILKEFLVLTSLLFVAGCAAPIKPEQAQPYVVNGNLIDIVNGPSIKIDNNFRYAGAEIIPSLHGGTKRQIFAGLNGAFLTVSIFDSNSEEMRRAVVAPANTDWEFPIKETTGPRWIRITGNKTPCCINLLRSEYLFVPAAYPAEPVNRGAGLPGTNIPGKLIVIAYGIPIPEDLLVSPWLMAEADFLNNDAELQLVYEHGDGRGPASVRLSPAQAAFLAEQEILADQAYLVE